MELVPPAPPGQILVIEDREIVFASVRQAMRTRPGAWSRYELVPANSLETAFGRLTARVALIILDLRVPSGPGSDDPLHGLHRLRRRAPLIPIGILAADDSVVTMCRAIEGGAAGVICKEAAIDDLLAAIGVMLRGGLYVPPQFIARMRDFDAVASVVREPLPALHSLSARQQSVLGLLLLGQSNKEIAERLGLRIGTVKNYVSLLLKLTRAGNRVQLRALGSGALGPSQ